MNYTLAMVQTLNEQQTREIDGGVVGPDGCIPPFPLPLPIPFPKEPFPFPDFPTLS